LKEAFRREFEEVVFLKPSSSRLLLGLRWSADERGGGAPTRYRNRVARGRRAMSDELRSIERRRGPQEKAMPVEEEEEESPRDAAPRVGSPDGHL